MKKLLSVLISSAVVAASVVPVFGADDITVLLDGKKLDFDVPPQIINDFTYVPMRAIFEALGASVEWDGRTQTITSEKDGTQIIMEIDSEVMYVDHHTVTLESPAMLVDSRTLVPARAVAESFDCNVGWNGNTRTVSITTSAEKNTSSAASLQDAADASVENDTDIDTDVKATPNPNAEDEQSAAQLQEFTGDETYSDETDDEAVTSDSGDEDAGSEASADAESGETVSDDSTTPKTDVYDEDYVEEASAKDDGAIGNMNATPDQNHVYDIEDDNENAAEGEYSELTPVSLSAITYDDTNERSSSYAKNFKILKIWRNEDGDYEIDYNVQTYRDDSGNIAVTYYCYDGEGNKIDSFTDWFHTWAYSWTDQESHVIFNGDTVRIALNLDKK